MSGEDGPKGGHDGSRDRRRDGAHFRLFIAIEIPAESRRAFVELQERIERESGGGLFRWIRPENLHLTLHFLASVPRDEVEPLVEAVARAAGGHAPFVLLARGIGFFPDVRRPRVLWAGFEPGEEPRGVHRTLAKELKGLGRRPERRPYAAHLTLGYVSRHVAIASTRGAAKAVSGLETGEICRFEVREITLVRSQTLPSGAVYTPLSRAALPPRAGGP